MSRPADALAWLGRQGARAVALSIFVGIAVPPLAHFSRPAFTPALLLVLCTEAPAKIDVHDWRPARTHRRWEIVLSTDESRFAESREKAAAPRPAIAVDRTTGLRCNEPVSVILRGA